MSNPAILIFSIFFAALLAGGVMLLSRSNRIRRECREALANRYSKDEIVYHDNRAHLLGVEKAAGKDVKGNGVLVLTEKELYFLYPLPKKEFIIPIRSIKRCLRATSFRGKPVQKPFLHIEYQDGEMGMNGIALYVNDLETMENYLKQQRKKNRQRRKK